jgi:mRNA interferase HigB
MKTDFPNVDPVKVKSGKTVYVFNIRQNEYRLVCAVHFDKARVYALRFMTHKEYEKGQWKEEL